MEARFGHDFGSVRIHNDSGAIKSAQAINAQAYTVGNNVVFGENKYAPTTGCGRELLAHELAHTIQQRGSSDALPSHEHEADAAEAQIGVIENKPIHIRACSSIGIARQPLFPEPVATKSQAELIKEIIYQKSCTTRAGFENWLGQEHLENFYWKKIAPKNFPGEHPSRALPPDFSGMAFLAENAAAQPTPLIESHSTAGVPGPLPSREQYNQWKLGRPKTYEEWAEQGALATDSIFGSMAMSKGDSELAAYGNSIIGAMAGHANAYQISAANQSQNDSKSSVPALYDKPSQEIDSAETQPDSFRVKAAAPDYGRSGPLDPTQPDWAFDKTEPGSPPRNDTQYSIPPSGGGGSGGGRGRVPGRTNSGNPPGSQGTLPAVEQGAPLAGVTDDEFDSALEEMSSPRITGGQSKPRIGGKAVAKQPRPPRVDVEHIARLPGETLPEALARVRTVIGQNLSETPANEAWNRAREFVLKTNNLTASNYEKLYNATRQRFWQEIRNDPAAMRYFTEAGFDFPSGSTTAPVLRITGAARPITEQRVSLDHSAEKAIGNNWTKALDADNLKMEFAMPNTYREIVQTRHPELRQP
jgi:hypothetical protein